MKQGAQRKENLDALLNEANQIAKQVGELMKGGKESRSWRSEK